MKIKTPYFEIKIDVLFIIVLFIFFLSHKLREFLLPFYTCYLFIVFHELSHMFIAGICGKNIDTFNVSISGVNITFSEERFTTKKAKYSKICAIKDIFIYMAGPISNFILALLFKDIKMIFEVNIFLGILNLLPIYPLDGYNILKSLLAILNIGENKIRFFIDIIGNIILIGLLILAFMCIIVIKNPSLLIFIVYLFLLKNTKIKEENLINKAGLGILK